jgi:hypothetical protein
MDLRERVAHFYFGKAGIVMRLQVDPALGVRTEEPGQTQSRVDGDVPLAVHDLIDATRVDTDSLRKRVLANTEGFHPVFEQDDSGMYKGYISFHDYSPSVVIDDFNVPRMAVSPDEAYAPLVVDANAVLPFAVMLQSLKAVSGGHAQKDKISRRRQLLQFFHGCALNVDEPGNPPPGEQFFGIGAAKADNHGQILAFAVNSVKRYHSTSVNNPCASVRDSLQNPSRHSALKQGNDAFCRGE